MKLKYYFDKNDIRKIVAKHYGINESDVNIRCYMETVGYGMNEHEEPNFEVSITLDDERTNKRGK